MAATGRLSPGVLLAFFALVALFAYLILRITSVGETQPSGPVIQPATSLPTTTISSFNASGLESILQSEKVSECLKLNPRLYPTTRESCILSAAVLERNESACRLISDPTLAGKCIYGIRPVKNIEQVNEVFESEDLIDCYSLLHSVSYHVFHDDCIHHKATRDLNASACGLLENATLQRTCRYRINKTGGAGK